MPIDTPTIKAGIVKKKSKAIKSTAFPFKEEDDSGDKDDDDKKHKSDKIGGAPDDGGGDDSDGDGVDIESDGESTIDSDVKMISNWRNRTKRINQSKLIKELLKIATTIEMKKFTMEGPLTERRKKFDTFQNNLRIVLGSTEETELIVSDFPEYQRPTDIKINTALGIFLHAKLEGNAKTIAQGHTNDGYAILQDLIRHCHKLTSQNKIDMYQHLLSLKQGRTESATNFLSRWRKVYNEGTQIKAYDMSESEAVDHVLSAMNINSTVYTNAIMNLMTRKQDEADDPDINATRVLTLSKVEDYFIDIDTKLARSRNGRTERVNTVTSQNIICRYCGKKGHKEFECRKKKRDMEAKRGKTPYKPQNRKPVDMSKIQCYRCKEYGHYANSPKCPLFKKNKEQANAATEKETPQQEYVCCAVGKECLCMAAVVSDHSSNTTESSVDTVTFEEGDENTSSSTTSSPDEDVEDNQREWQLQNYDESNIRLQNYFDGILQNEPTIDGSFRNEPNDSLIPDGNEDVITMHLDFQGDSTQYPFTSFSRMHRYNSLNSYRDKLLQLHDNAFAVKLLVDCGMDRRAPPYERWLTRREIYSYQCLLGKEQNRLRQLHKSQRPFVRRAISAVQMAMKSICDHVGREIGEDNANRFWNNEWDAFEQRLSNWGCQPDNSSDGISENSINQGIQEMINMSAEGIQDVTSPDSDPSDIRNWGVDSGATSHFTFNMDDLHDVEDCNIDIQLADGSMVNGTKMGTVYINIVTNKGRKCRLTLKRVICVPNLSRRLFSVCAFCKNKAYSVVFQGEGGSLHFGDGHSVTINYDAFRQSQAPIISQTEVVNVTSPDIINADDTNDSDDSSSEEGETESSSATSEENVENERNETENNNSNVNDSRNHPTTQEIESWHQRVAYAPLRDLLTGSQNEVWSDVKFRLASGTFNTDCKISVISKAAMSKRAFPKAQKAFQRIFVDLIPGMNKSVNQETEFASCILIVDQFTRWIAMQGMQGSTSMDVIKALKEWGATVGGLNKLEMIEYVRSDAGNQFTAKPFKEFCKDLTVKCELAAPRHQEMNSICEANWKRIKETARKMLVQASLSHHFWYLACQYAIAILNVMPTRGLSKEQGRVTTPFELVHNYKPALKKFHTFGCPVVYKREPSIIRSKRQQSELNETGFDSLRSEALQQGARGIFVGFPRNQAGALIYVAENRQRVSNLIVSQDVAYDDNFDSVIANDRFVFKGGKNIRSIGINDENEPGEMPDERT